MARLSHAPCDISNHFLPATIDQIAGTMESEKTVASVTIIFSSPARYQCRDFGSGFLYGLPWAAAIDFARLIQSPTRNAPWPSHSTAISSRPTARP